MAVLLRKAQPGSDSYGHTWTGARSVVEVSDEQAADLLRIRDAGFEVVTKPDDDVTEVDPVEEPAEDSAGDAVDDTAESGGDVTEVDPTRDDASPAPRKRGRPRRIVGE